MDTESTNEKLQPANPEVDNRALKKHEIVGVRLFTTGALALVAAIIGGFLGNYFPATIQPVLANTLGVAYLFSVLTMPVTFVGAFINIFILIYDHAPLRSKRVAATAGVLIGSFVVEAIACLIFLLMFAAALTNAMTNAMNP